MLHFCQSLPIILVGCKMDLRDDPKTLEELRKISQKPVTPGQVHQLYLLASNPFRQLGPSARYFGLTLHNRVMMSRKRLGRKSTSNARLRLAKVLKKSSKLPHVKLFSAKETQERGTGSARYCNLALPVIFRPFNCHDPRRTTGLQCATSVESVV